MALVSFDCAWFICIDMHPFVLGLLYGYWLRLCDHCVHCRRLDLCFC